MDEEPKPFLTAFGALILVMVGIGLLAAVVLHDALGSRPKSYGGIPLSPADYARAKAPGRCWGKTGDVTPQDVQDAARCDLARDALAGLPPPPPIPDCAEVDKLRADARKDGINPWGPVLCREESQR